MLLYFGRNSSFIFSILILDVKFISGLLWLNFAAGELLREIQGKVWNQVEWKNLV